MMLGDGDLVETGLVGQTNCASEVCIKRSATSAE